MCFIQLIAVEYSSLIYIYISDYIYSLWFGVITKDAVGTWKACFKSICTYSVRYLPRN